MHQYGVYLTRKRREDSPAYIISLTFAVLAAVCEKFKSGNGICTFNEICARLQVPDRDVSKAADLLENRRFLIRADSMNRGYIPARMINDISMEEFVHSVYGETPQPLSAAVAETLLEKGAGAFEPSSAADWLKG